MEHEETKRREAVVPGEVIAVGSELLPGEGTQREGEEIIATRFGLLERVDKLVKVIPLAGVYLPRKGNVVIGQIVDVTFNGWIVDIRAPSLAFLPIMECYRKAEKKDLLDYYNFRDIIVTKIKAVKRRAVDLTMKEQGLQKLEGGVIILINPTRVPRVIGRAGSMINTIKKGSNCSIIVGQNGVIWIKGENVNDELLAKEAIELIAKKPFVEGLTEQIKNFLSKNERKKS